MGALCYNKKLYGITKLRNHREVKHKSCYTPIAHALEHTLSDIVQAIPILLIVYALLYWIENRLRSTPALLEKSAEFGPVVGALAGLIPQCGFSAAAAALFGDGFLAPATLVAVFLATSDEALPILLSEGASGTEIAALFGSKFVLAVVSGYILRLIWGPSKKTGTTRSRSIWRVAAAAAVTTARCAASWAARWRPPSCCSSSPLSWSWPCTASAPTGWATIMLKDSVFQPIICAVIGLIPSCAISVVLTQLYTSGVIGMGSLIAGLSTGAGFGYMVLLGNENGRRHARPIILATLAFAIIGGIITHFLFPF